jgi:transposase-like protein
MIGGIVDLNKEKRWQEIIQRQKESGKSQAQFCNEQGLIPHQFSYWKKALERRAGKHPNKKKQDLGFVPLKLSQSLEPADKNHSDSAERIEISKITVRMSISDKAALTCVLRSLDMTGC